MKRTAEEIAEGAYVRYTVNRHHMDKERVARANRLIHGYNVTVHTALLEIFSDYNTPSFGIQMPIPPPPTEDPPIAPPTTRPTRWSHPAYQVSNGKETGMFGKGTRPASKARPKSFFRRSKSAPSFLRRCGTAALITNK